MLGFKTRLTVESQVFNIAESRNLLIQFSSIFLYSVKSYLILIEDKFEIHYY